MQVVISRPNFRIERDPFSYRKLAGLGFLAKDRLRYGCSKIMGARGGSENETQFRGYTSISFLKERLDNKHHGVFLTREVKIHVRDESWTSAVGG